jgi:site-specific DNA recombinase
LLHLLDSRHVAGIRVFRGEEIGQGNWPAIIDEGMFREVQPIPVHRTARKCYRGVGVTTLDAFVKDAAIDLLERLDVTGAVSASVLSDADNAAIDADQAGLAELKAMWDAREITTTECREMRKTVEEKAGNRERVNAVLRFLFAAVRIGESHRGQRHVRLRADRDRAEQPLALPCGPARFRLVAPNATRTVPLSAKTC